MTNSTSAAGVKIARVSEETTVGPQGQRVQSIVVTFNYGSHGPFTERFDKQGFDPIAVNAKLTAFGQQLAALGGM